MFDDIIGAMICNKTLNSNEMFFRGRKLNISTVFIKQSYFTVPKDVRPNRAYFFIVKILIKWEIQQSDIDFKKFMKLYKKCAVNPYYFLVIDTTLESDSSLRFEKNPLEKN